MKTILAFLIMSATTMAATLNVPSQYATVQLAVTAAQPGDTVLLAAGTYNETVTTARAGSAGNKITIDGQGVATVKTLNINHAHHTIKNCTISGAYLSLGWAIKVNMGAHFTTIQDCIIDNQNSQGAWGISWGTNANNIEGEASDCVIERTTIKNVVAYPMLGLSGYRNVVRNCTFRDGTSVDFIRLFGVNNVIQDSVFLNNIGVSGYGFHPDFIQTFGNGGGKSMGHIIERNLINNIRSGQIFQLNATGQETYRDWTIRNNIFANCDLAGGGSMPEVKFYNNIFYKVATPITFGFRAFTASGVSRTHPIYNLLTQPTPSGSLVAEGDNGQTNYGGWYQVRAATIAAGVPLEAGKTYYVYSRGGARVLYNGVQYANLATFTAVDSVLSYSVTGGTSYEQSVTTLYAYGSITYKGTPYLRDAVFQAASDDRTYVSSWPEKVTLWRVVVETADGSTCKNNVWLDCGEPGKWSGFYGFDPRCQNVSADFNFVAKDGFQAVKAKTPQNPIGSPLGWNYEGFYEPNGINGGNPGFTDPSNLDFRLQPGSILIDQGVVIAGVTSDFANTIRPLGAAPDIGAYEYDDGSPPPDPPAPGTPPDPPSGLSATAGSSSSILLEWTDNADDEAYFELDRSLNGSTWTTTNQIDANTTAHVVTGLNASTLYYFRLRAVNGDGNSAYTATVSATTQAPPVVGTPPAAPSNFQTTAIGAHSVSMAWDDNSADETGFQIDCSPDGVAWSTIANLSANMESWTNSGLAASTTYYYRVRAVNAYGNSAWSNDDATTTAASPPSRPARAQSARGDLIGQ